VQDIGANLSDLDSHDTRAIQAYLGHRNIQNTTRYTALAPLRFKEFFRD
jgi:site-specific recombinase XerD